MKKKFEFRRKKNYNQLQDSGAPSSDFQIDDSFNAELVLIEAENFAIDDEEEPHDPALLSAVEKETAVPPLKDSRSGFSRLSSGLKNKKFLPWLKREEQEAGILGSQQLRDDRGVGNIRAFFLLFSSSFGSGFIGLAWAFSFCGLMELIIAITVSALLSCYTVNLLIKCKTHLNPVSHVQTFGGSTNIVSFFGFLILHKIPAEIGRAILGKPGQFAVNVKNSNARCIVDFSFPCSFPVRFVSLDSVLHI